MHPGSFLKRRWRLVTLIAAAVFLCLLVAAAIGLRDNIFRAMKDPGQPFQTYEPPPQPDYVDAANWALRPASSEGGAGDSQGQMLRPGRNQPCCCSSALSGPT